MTVLVQYPRGLTRIRDCDLGTRFGVLEEVLIELHYSKQEYLVELTHNSRGISTAYLWLRGHPTRLYFEKLPGMLAVDVINRDTIRGLHFPNPGNALEEWVQVEEIKNLVRKVWKV